LIGILVDLPALISSAVALNASSGTHLDQDIDGIVARFHRMSLEIRSWLEVEAEPLLLMDSSGRTTDIIQYPDLMAGINDCVSHKALLMVQKALDILIQTRSRSEQPPMSDPCQQIQATILLGDAHVGEVWRQRLIYAFNYVHRECQFAAKPLGFGLRHNQSIGFLDEPLDWKKA
tara:strand:- start:76 stop:600 length:525 start_codon:yes stop_codon:yes gene_type:complete